MADLPAPTRDLIENRDEELELYLRNGITPVGSLTAFAGATAPTGWLICNGASVTKEKYPDLFRTIGYTYGGSGANFNLPNLKGRVPVGLDSVQTEFDTLGETGGSKTHTLTTNEMPGHTHGGSTTTDGSHSHTYSDFPNANQELAQGTFTFRRMPSTANTSTAGSHSHTITTTTTGGGLAHNNLQPYVVVNWIIKT